MELSRHEEAGRSLDTMKENMWWKQESARDGPSSMSQEERMHETEEQLQQELADEARTKIIEEERARILAAHAKNLDIKHLPKGVLATEADFAIFNRK